MTQLNDLQIKTIKSILNIFETGHPLGRYDQVTLLAGDTGGLTYGRSQTTLNSGNLHDMLQDYVAAADSLVETQIAALLPRFKAKDPELDHDRYVHNLLRAAADETAMRGVQDEFFTRRYWQRAQTIWKSLGLSTALSAAIVYDGKIHGSFEAMRDRTIAALGGTPTELGEKSWITGYVKTRKNWLGTHSNTLLHQTVYRMETFEDLIENQCWDLDLPLAIRGHEIEPATFEGTPPGVYNGPDAGSRTLKVTSPLMRGRDVRLVQLALSNPAQLGARIKADGVLGNGTATHLKNFQAAKGLKVDGVAGKDTLQALGVMTVVGA